MVQRFSLPVVLLLLASACGRVGYGPQYDHELVVTSVDDTEAPTTLRGALGIAATLQGSTRIFFDPSAFPPSRPTVVAVASPLPEVSDDTTIDGTGSGATIESAGTSEPLIRGGGSGVVIRGLTFRHLTGPAIEVTVDGTLVEGNFFEDNAGDAIVVTGASDVSIRSNRIFETGGIAISASMCSRLNIKNNTIEHAGSSLVSVTDCTFVNVYDNFMNIGDKETQRGVSFERVTESAICDNIIDPGSARLVNFSESSRNTVCRNVLDRGDAGVVLEGGSTDNLVFQNMVIESYYDGVYVDGTSTGNVVVHNSFLACSTAIADGSPDLVENNNLVTDDPSIFVAPAAPTYDFHLVAGDANIDAGEDTGFDCLPDSAASFLGAAPDLGAVESY